MKKIAVARIKGQVNVSGKVKDTLQMLRLYRKNYCVVLDAKPDVMGMVRKVKDFVVWKEISGEAAEKLGSRFIRLKFLKAPKRRAGRIKALDAALAGVPK